MGPERTARAHAPTAALGARHDGRSVGELLRDADLLARNLLLDLTAEDAPQLLRSWDRLIDAATNAWNAIDHASISPASQAAYDTGQPPPQVDATDPMLRLQTITGGISTTLATARWPGHGPSSPVVEQIADGFDRVADLLERRDVALPARADVRADVAAAQMRVMHTVYLGAHATTSALQQHGRQLHHQGGRSRGPAELASPGLPYAIGPTGRWVQRLGVCERLAGDYVRGTTGGFAAAVAGEAVTRPDDSGRLHHELARWDVQVHRSLAADPSPHNLVLASRTQAFIAATALPVLTAAHHAGLYADGDPGALAATIEASGTAWNELATRWADLAPADTRVDHDLAHAAAQLRAAAREITHTPTGRATTEDLLERPDVARTIDSLQHALVSAVDVAHLTRDPATDPDLTGPARPLSIRAHNDTELANEVGSHDQSGQDVLWVTPADVLRNRHVPLPRPVAEGLDRASMRVVSASERAAASSCAEAFGAAALAAGSGSSRPRLPTKHPSTTHALGEDSPRRGQGR